MKLPQGSGGPTSGSQSCMLEQATASCSAAANAPTDHRALIRLTPEPVSGSSGEPPLARDAVNALSASEDSALRRQGEQRVRTGAGNLSACTLMLVPVAQKTVPPVVRST